jgi:hypothetical protein
MHGKKIVLAASRTESNEREQDCWMQMLYATLPAKIAHRSLKASASSNPFSFNIFHPKM